MKLVYGLSTIACIAATATALDCNSWESACSLPTGDVCYENQYHYCPSSGGVNMVCEIDELACGNAGGNSWCYKPWESSCQTNSQGVNVQCGAYGAICGDTCYDPSMTSCFVDTPSSAPLLCPSYNSVCNGKCYDPSVNACLPDDTLSTASLAPGVLCPNWYSVCNGVCYDPSVNNCLLDKTTGEKKQCLNAHFLCNGDCYDPSEVQCLTTVLGTEITCTYDQISCGPDCLDNTQICDYTLAPTLVPINTTAPTATPTANVTSTPSPTPTPTATSSVAPATLAPATLAPSRAPAPTASLNTGAGTSGNADEARASSAPVVASVGTMFATVLIAAYTVIF